MKLIKTYQDTVKKVQGLFKQHFNIDNPMHWRDISLPRKGCLDKDKKIFYAFHGVGCEVIFPKFSIDFDFGHEGRIDGFNLWFLKLFAKEKKAQFPELVNGELLEHLFNEASSNGEIAQIFKENQDDLYYLVEMDTKQ